MYISVSKFADEATPSVRVVSPTVLDDTPHMVSVIIGTGFGFAIAPATARALYDALGRVVADLNVEPQQVAA